MERPTARPKTMDDDLSLHCDEILNEERSKDADFYASLTNEEKQSFHMSRTNPLDSVDWVALRKKRIGKRMAPPTFESVKRLRLTHLDEASEDRVRRWEQFETRYCKLRRVDGGISARGEHVPSSFEGKEKV